ncbi:MAG: cytochrome c [Hyphomicrobiaceae bacterium]
MTLDASPRSTPRLPARVLAAAALVIGIGSTALAQSGANGTPTNPDPEKGRQIAERFCKNCHIMEGAAPTTVTPGIPSFKAIANKPGQTGRHIRDVLIQPHRPMPDLQLSNEEILNLLAYLDGLRSNAATPSFLTPGDGPKPVYPRQG